MSYLRLDNGTFSTTGTMMMGADGSTRYAHPNAYRASSHTGSSFRSQTGSGLGLGPSSGYGSGLHPYHRPNLTLGQRMQPQGPMGLSYRTMDIMNAQQQQQPQRPQTSQLALNIRGIRPLMARIGSPDVVDHHKGGIAIWSSSTLRKRGYKFLQRVEIIDESVPSMYPVKHFSNVYIWVKLNLTDTMLANILDISTDIYYDRGKELLIVRSDCLDTAVAQASLIALYSQGRVSYYEIVNYDMLNKYYHQVRKAKSKKAIYTVLNSISKPPQMRRSRTGKKRS